MQFQYGNSPGYKGNIVGGSGGRQVSAGGSSQILSQVGTGSLPLVQLPGSLGNTYANIEINVFLNISINGVDMSFEFRTVKEIENLIAELKQIDGSATTITIPGTNYRIPIEYKQYLIDTLQGNLNQILQTLTDIPDNPDTSGSPDLSVPYLPSDLTERELIAKIINYIKQNYQGFSENQATIVFHPLNDGFIDITIVTPNPNDHANIVQLVSKYFMEELNIHVFLPGSSNGPNGFGFNSFELTIIVPNTIGASVTELVEEIKSFILRENRNLSPGDFDVSPSKFPEQGIHEILARFNSLEIDAYKLSVSIENYLSNRYHVGAFVDIFYLSSGGTKPTTTPVPVQPPPTHGGTVIVVSIPDDFTNINEMVRVIRNFFSQSPLSVQVTPTQDPSTGGNQIIIDFGSGVSVSNPSTLATSLAIFIFQELDVNVGISVQAVDTQLPQGSLTIIVDLPLGFTNIDAVLKEVQNALNNQYPGKVTQVSTSRNKTAGNPQIVAALDSSLSQDEANYATLAVFQVISNLQINATISMQFSRVESHMGSVGTQAYIEDKAQAREFIFGTPQVVSSRVRGASG